MTIKLYKSYFPYNKKGTLCYPDYLDNILKNYFRHAQKKGNKSRKNISRSND